MANFGFRTALKLRHELRGDKDTISAMAEAIAGACYGIGDIPEKWRDLPGKRDYTNESAEKLWQVKTKGELRNEGDDT